MEVTDILDILCLCEINLAKTYIAQPEDYPMKNKGRYHCGMFYTLKGTEQYVFADRCCAACPGSVLFIPKNESYTIEMNDAQSVVTVIDFELKQGDTFRPFLIKAGENSGVRELFQELLSCYEGGSAARLSQMKSIFYKVISRLILIENTYTNSIELQKIKPAVDYMHSHLFEGDFRIDALAKLAGISNRHFEKLFFKEFKQAPKDYVLSKKIQLAKELLKSEKSTVTAVAHSLGYTDIYHFSKLFKLKTGYSPSEYKSLKAL